MALSIGTEAPDFTLTDHLHRQITLSSFRGERNVLVVFYPAAFGGIAAGELDAVRDDPGTFQNGHTQILAVSVDNVFTLQAWANARDYQFPLLWDFWPHGQVAKAYDVFNYASGMALRGTFLVDKRGTLRFTEVNGFGEPRDPKTWKRALDALT